MADLTWKAHAACRPLPVELFFPVKDRFATDLTRQVCARCPVADPCLDDALTSPHTDGIWGGLGQTERNRLRQRLGMTAANSRHGTTPKIAAGCTCDTCGGRSETG